MCACFIIFFTSQLHDNTIYLNILTNIKNYSIKILSINVFYMTALNKALITICSVIIASIYYTIQFMRTDLFRFILYSLVLLISGLIFVSTASIFIMFVAYEGILLPTSLMLEYFSKTGRSREATRFMILWTQLGALILFFIISKFIQTDALSTSATMYISADRFETNILYLLTFFGFGTKMPVWPFYWWLPEAHVEVSTNFSIVLSGVSIKFAFIGFIRFLELLGTSDVYWICAIFALIGLLDAALKIDTESDIKKIVAYQTVVEMHAQVMYICLDFESFIDVVIFIFIGHCWLSTISFIIVDIIAKRYHTRNIEYLYGILAESPRITKVIFLIIFIYSSIPGTLIFSIEYYAQLFSSTNIFNIILFIVIQLFLVLWSKNIWWILWGGDALYHSKAQTFSFNTVEILFIFILILQLTPAATFIDIGGL